MAMMYKIVAQALDKAGLSECYHPQDYLNFFCLGKREASSSRSSSHTTQQTENRGLVCYLLFWILLTRLLLLLMTLFSINKFLSIASGFKAVNLKSSNS